MLNAEGTHGNEVLQQKTKRVTGTVVDESGEPVIGANVLVKGVAKVGVVTDIDGKFTLALPSGATTIVISFIGYEEKEVKVKDGKPLQVVLSENAELLDEVQVIAYGTQSKVSVTGAMSSVRTEELLKVPNASITNALAGAMTGVSSVQSIGQPGNEDATLYIRGSLR